MADILDASHGGVKKTYLMYRCNLSFKQMKCYSRFMLNSGLLHMMIEEAESDPALYEVTEKGREFLRAFKGLKSLLK
jgi:predicted transcriptional regulator